jgi:hypothetical protein
MSSRVAVLLSLLVCAPLFAATQGGTMPVPLPLFPPNNWWNTDISQAPVDVNSASYLPFMGGAGRALHPDFGGDYVDPVDCPVDCVYGIPFTVVDGS